MNIQDVREQLKKLDEQYQRDRTMLQQMIEFLSRTNSGESTELELQSEPRGTIEERIAGFISEYQGNFTKKELCKFIKERDSKFFGGLSSQSISMTLWKLNKKGKIKMVIAKKGAGAAIYSKSESNGGGNQ